MKPICAVVFAAGLLASTSSIGATPEKPAANPLVEVTSKTKAQCVEYFELKGKTYCSTQPLLNTQIAKEIADAESFKLDLNKNEWKVGWTDLKPDVRTIEYIRHGESIENWKALITTQFIKMDTQQVTPKQIARQFIAGLQQKGFNPAVTFYVENNEETIFEFQIDQPAEQAQDEIQKIIKTEQGLFLIHYVVKQSDMGEKEREKWLEFIKKSQLK